jgi:hypothetical protein
MAHSATSRPIGRQRGSLTLLRGSRGIPETVSMRTTTALAPCLEGIALADDAIAAAERIVLAAAAGSRQAVVNEAGRLAYRAADCRTELRRMAGAIDPRPKRAA